MTLEPEPAVLIVDDRPENLLAFSAMLEPLGTRLVQAESGEDALRRLLREDFAVVVLDVQMPTMDGIETARIIRGRASLRHLPVIFVTASDYNEERIREAYALGAVDYVFKPVAAEILMAKVQTFVELYKARKKDRDRALALENVNLQLEAMNEELDAFTHAVSHDLRAPVRRLREFSRALLEMPAGQSELASSYLKNIENSSRQMDALIMSLLRLSQATRSQMNIQPVDLSELVESLVLLCRRATPGRQVEVHVQPGMRVYGDQELLRVVLDNLISNAWKYTAKVESARIEVGASKHEGEVVFFVKDNGAGFDMEYADKLFEVFGRLHSQSEFEGTGVGLTTVERVIRRHQGAVWAEAVVGAGASFFFTLGAPLLEDPEPVENDV